MKHWIFFVLFLVPIVCLTGCREEFTTSSAGLVVEGWIDNNEFPVVYITTSIPLDLNYKNVEELNNSIIRWAKVTVSDGDTTVTLTGKGDEHATVNYMYTTSWLRGKTGKSYTLTVDYNNYHATAITTIPPTTYIDSFQVKKCEDSDTLYQINAFFKDNPTESNYYKFLCMREKKDKEYYSSTMGAFSDEILDSLPSIPVLRSYGLLTKEKFTPYFSKNDLVYIKFVQMDSIGYQFWHDFENSVNLSRNNFISSINNLHGNVIGAKGYWIGYGASYYTIKISE
jgi:hypothetical protein